MQKPKVGDIVTVRLYMHGEEPYPYDIPRTVKVDAVYDSLSEDWGDDGELAMGQADADEAAGKTGDWYIVFSQGSGPVTETWSAASYEVQVA